MNAADRNVWWDVVMKTGPGILVVLSWIGGMMFAAMLFAPALDASHAREAPVGPPWCGEVP